MLFFNHSAKDHINLVRTKVSRQALILGQAAYNFMVKIHSTSLLYFLSSHFLIGQKYQTKPLEISSLLLH